MTVRELFDFITDVNIDDNQVDEYLESMQEKISSRPFELTDEQVMDEEVFKQTFIPRSLNDVIDHERHILQAIDGNTKDMFYNSVVGLSDDYQSKKEDELENQVENIEKKEVVEEEIKQRKLKTKRKQMKIVMLKMKIIRMKKKMMKKKMKMMKKVMKRVKN